MLDKIKNCFKKDKVLYSFHAKEEMRNEEFGLISDKEICEAIMSGEVIESYQQNEPYPSCLIYGKTGKGRPLHIVCAYSETEGLTVIITAYQPDESIWLDYRRRKK
ncbi:MAG: hypothetical protein A3G39_01485 [Deltaproteobacteria bacterium RIFCSPLOWO2_12_FULL_43_16]|nr:MAG: hypothetical protein A2Z89_00090 [Deltaproteobacteria bacterium GWA2_43_19]OGQ09629.1 MAG: hypothetical protein A3D30_01555 [Deltaproteobacteria bacterium RIFCSPHIGHO2_02_FULL_43_33]OGQ36205.1 MAG: hypothetical protein A3A85_08645 [Deltaproteobacteria bacterium RIFCSPLOWO2_01_FULL_42_9]OGQ60957.1 MAG: hypothetical protein A3G39_01485 [Deltaproteobacteria bacterium RIFCSPLOWO2_12_FULL_43_16]HBR17370.1 hypothetical protein [Deltaproteobacteria bacterium]